MSKTPTKKILAVSGGIDSVVLLHKFRNDSHAIVAHFNHGTRPSADADEEFVKNLALKYNKPFFSKKESLGANVSEETARAHRYNFLKSLAKQQNGKIITAHHADDILETIAINLTRGTGWRGLTPMGDAAILRPLLKLTKKYIYKYASKNNLAFRQDPTNTDDKYLRNRLRKYYDFALVKQKLLKLIKKQRKLRQKIENITKKMLTENNIYSKQSLKNLPDPVATEFLRAALHKVNKSATAPQLALLLKALRTLPPGKKYNLSKDYYIKITKTNFYL
jgi:tRNA(Ile)-lysidine synthase